MKQYLLLAALGVVLLATLGIQVRGENNAGESTLIASLAQREFYSVEPILMTVRLESNEVHNLPAIPGMQTKGGTLQFEITPAVKSRKNAKPLPLEAEGAAVNARIRDYDLYEWFQLPGKGTFTVRAVFQSKDMTCKSEPQSFTIGRPAKGDYEFPAMARIHHPPWCNYGVNKFCGDTFDLVKRWPKSRYVKYCDYWNGRYSQNKKQYSEAITYYKKVVKDTPNFALADDAAFGIVQCLYAEKKLKQAQQANTQLLQRLALQARKLGSTTQAQTVVQRLGQAMSERINRDLGIK